MLGLLACTISITQTHQISCIFSITASAVFHIGGMMDAPRNKKTAFSAVRYHIFCIGDTTTKV
jgi:hypothetical protein